MIQCDEVEWEPRCRFLVDAANLLASSLDYEETLGTVARLAVGSLADFCVIDLLEGGELQRTRAAHADPERAGLVQELLRFPSQVAGDPSVRAVSRGKPVLVAGVSGALLDSMAPDPRHRRLLAELGPRSFIAVPLRAGDRVMGVMLLASSTRSYGRDDVDLARRLAGLAGVEMANAELYREARHSIAARDRVLGIVAHDLRNPLNTVAASAELLRDVPLSAERRAYYLDVILRSAGRMDRLIQDLLDVARLEADRLPLHLAPEDPRALAREAVELNTDNADSRSLRLRLREGGGGPAIPADRDRVLRALSNLIDNAIKFTPEGGRVEVGVRPTEAGVRFTVSDTGPGLEPDQIPHLFQPFWQARPDGSDGAGLGLAITRGIVDAHGGEVWAESVQGEGSSFHFTLPAGAEASPRGGAAHETRASSNS